MAIADRSQGVVIVTGGSSGLGSAVAEAVAQRGGTPIVLDLRPPTGAWRYELVDLAATAAAGGWILASRSAPSITLAVETVLLSEFLFWSGIAAMQRSALLDFVRIGRRGIRSAVAKPSAG